MAAFGLILLIFGFLMAAVTGLSLWWVHDRGRKGRRQLGLESYQRSLELARRCDVIEARHRRLQRLQGIDHLAFLVQLGDREQRWSESKGSALQHYVAALYAEASSERPS